jgi:hypothetical protein
LVNWAVGFDGSRLGELSARNALVDVHDRRTGGATHHRMDIKRGDTVAARERAEKVDRTRADGLDRSQEGAD